MKPVRALMALRLGNEAQPWSRGSLLDNYPWKGSQVEREGSKGSRIHWHPHLF